MTQRSSSDANIREQTLGTQNRQMNRTMTQIGKTMNSMSRMRNSI
jgi:hypothetical protein